MGKAGKAVEMSVDHKPECQVEIDRITKSGSNLSNRRGSRAKPPPVVSPLMLPLIILWSGERSVRRRLTQPLAGSIP
mgnify:CR=1 FL=1